MATIEEFRALCKTANHQITLTESTVEFYDPESFKVFLAFVPFYESVREMAMHSVIAPVSPCIATSLRIFHKAIESVPMYGVTVYEVLGTMSTVVPQKSLPCTASRWLSVLREIGWEDGDLAAYIEELDDSAWESN